jgi:uncharacterized OsmC-like protein
MPYLQWHICHLVASPVCRYCESSNSSFSKHPRNKSEENNMATTQKVAKILNGVNVSDLLTTIEAIKGSPTIAKFNFRVRNRWEGGGQNRSTVNTFYGAAQEHSRETSFVLEADEPPVLLGKDAAANPVEHLLHALAACLTTSMVYHAAAQGIQLEEVESSLEGDIDLHGFLGLDRSVRKGYQGIRINFRIKADVPDDRLQEIVGLGTGYSPVFDSLTRGVPVSVSAQRL